MKCVVFSLNCFTAKGLKKVLNVSYLACNHCNYGHLTASAQITDTYNGAFSKTDNSFQQIIIFTKSSILDVWQVYEYGPETLISQTYGKAN